MPWKPMSEEEAEEVINSQPPDTTTLSPEESRRLREAHLVRRRPPLSEDEIRAELEASFGPLD
jgi:hypothetical protein